MKRNLLLRILLRIWKKLAAVMVVLALFSLISSCGTNESEPTPPDSGATDSFQQTEAYETLVARANIQDMFRASESIALNEQPKAEGSVDFTPSLQPLFAGSPRVDMKLLILAATAADPNLEAISYFAKEIGVPFDVIITTQETLSQASLIKANGDGKYQGIVLTELGLLANNAGVFQSSFTTAEWNLLWQYEREFNVRQLVMSGFPGAFPEDYGLRFSNGIASTSANPINAKLSAAGATVFASLKATANIPIKNSFAYLSTVCGAACPTVTTTPLLTDGATGTVLAASTTTADGREVLSLTMNHNSFLDHTGLLSYDLINWVTGGIFIGERRMYFSIDIDDWYLESEVWNPATNDVFPEDEYQFRITAKDVYAAKAGVLNLRSRFPSPNFNYNQVFNAEGADPSATANCGANATLSQATLCVDDFFPFVSHTYTHAEMDFLDYATAKGEFTKNIDFAQSRLRTFDKKFIVTGKHSGLGWYRKVDAPAGSTCLYDQVLSDPFCQYGLNASNKDMLKAAVDVGIEYMAANRGWFSHVAPCDSCFLRHPLESRIKLIPRWPTNIFFNTTNPTENASEFNYLYGPQGIIKKPDGSPFFATNQSWQQILGFETSITMRHILSMSPYPHYVHQGNLREYQAGRSLTYDYAEDVLKTYSSYFAVPLVSQSWEGITSTLDKRTSFFNAGASGVLNKLDNTVTITSANGGTVFVTGTSFANTSSFSYGGKTVSELNLSAGQSLTNGGVDNGTPTVPAPGNLLTNGGFETNLTAWSSCGGGQTVSTTDANQGTKAMTLKNGNGAAACLYQNADIVVGKTYTFSCLAKRTLQTTWSSIGLGFSTTDYTELSTESKEVRGSAYTLHSISLVAPAGAARAAVSLYSEDSATFDNCNLSVSEVTTPVVPTPSSSLLSNSDFENGLDGWNLTGCGTGSVTSSSDASSGSKSMQLSGATICVGQGVSSNISGGTSYTLSCDVKNAGGTYADMSLYTIDGTAVAFKALTSAAFQRVSITGTTPVATTNLYAYFYKADGGSIVVDNCVLNTP